MSVVSRDWDEIIKWDNVYNGKLIVVRIDSALAEDAETIRRLGKQMAFLRRAMNLKIVVVQGSRSQIATALKQEGAAEGTAPASGALPVLDAESSVLADETLRDVNERLVDVFRKASKESVTPLSLAAYEHHAVRLHYKTDLTKPIEAENLIVNKSFFIRKLADHQKLNLPVLYPFCAIGPLGNSSKRLVSVDADAMALAIAREMKAHRLIICSNVLGILRPDGSLISEIFIDEVSSLLIGDQVREDMKGRLSSAEKAVQEMDGGAVVVMDVRYPDSLLNELLSDAGGGTLIRRRPERPAERDFAFVRAGTLKARLAG